jgi:ankyrin repeat protein
MRLKVNPATDGGGGRYPHPLLAAMAKGHKDSVTALLGLSSRVHNGADITEGLKSKVDSVKPNHTPTSWACEEGHLAIAAFLLDQGAQVSVQDLVRFVENGNIEAVKMVLEKGADATVTTKNGRTLLGPELRAGHLEIVKILLEKGPDTIVTGGNGWTPLHIALRGGHLEIAKMLTSNSKSNEAGAY